MTRLGIVPTVASIIFGWDRQEFTARDVQEVLLSKEYNRPVTLLAVEMAIGHARNFGVVTVVGKREGEVLYTTTSNPRGGVTLALSWASEDELRKELSRREKEE